MAATDASSTSSTSPVTSGIALIAAEPPRPDQFEAGAEVHRRPSPLAFPETVPTGEREDGYPQASPAREG
jgi:hypothetical protein